MLIADMRYGAAVIGLSFTFCLPACGAASPPAADRLVPDLYGVNLDVAEEQLDALGLGYTIDSGDDAVVFEHLWSVCDQSPGPGKRARVVTLTVEHSCRD